MQMCDECLKVYDESEYAKCPFCAGDEGSYFLDEENGDDTPQRSECADCDGSGRMECDLCEGEGEINSATCTKCNGDGGMECYECNGTGYATYHNGVKIS